MLFGKSVSPFLKKKQISRRMGSMAVTIRQLQLLFAYPAQLPRFSPFFSFLLFKQEKGKNLETQGVNSCQCLTVTNSQQVLP
jgi:hypothetical protein